jgi:hypothetical protein
MEVDRRPRPENIEIDLLPPPGAATRATPPPPPACLTVSARELYRRFAENSTAAERYFKDKTVLVTGQVQAVGREILGLPYVILSGGVQCVFPRDAEDTLAQLHSGQDLTVGGQCLGLLVWVQMNNCTVAEVA